MQPNRNTTPHAKLAEALEKIPDSRIADVLLEGMSATSISRSGAVEPDTRTRIQAANLVIQYKVGRPCISDGPPPPPAAEKSGEFLDILIKSPSLMKGVEEDLAKAKMILKERQACP